jgi:hypothetical protein
MDKQLRIQAGLTLAALCLISLAMTAGPCQQVLSGVLSTHVTSAGSPAGARNFDGTSSDYLAVNDSASLRSPSTAITAAAWVRLASPVVQYTPVFQKKFSTAAWSYMIRSEVWTSNPYRTLTGWLRTSSSVGTAASPGLVLGTWYFAVLRWTSGAKITLDIYNTDGSSFSHSESTSAVTGSIAYDSGQFVVGGIGDTHTWNGDIANVFIDDTSLSDADVQTLLGGTLPEGSPSALWAPLCGNSPENDLSGNGNNLTVNGTTFVSGPSGVSGCP